MAVLVLILVSASLLILILAAPVILNVDTCKEDYRICWGGLCSLQAIAPADHPGVRLRIGFWKRNWYLTQRQFRSSSRKGGRTVNGEDKRKGLSGKSIRRLWRVIKTFRVNKFDIVLDTGDYVLNAQLFPLFQFCNGRWGNWRMSFRGDSSIQVEAESKMIQVLYAWWRRK
jgi:hypothetical protein